MDFSLEKFKGVVFLFGAGTKWRPGAGMARPKNVPKMTSTFFSNVVLFLFRFSDLTTLFSDSLVQETIGPRDITPKVIFAVNSA